MTPPAAAVEPLQPRWPIDGVGALMSTRAGGVSTGAWQGLNLGVAVGDAPGEVAENRRRFDSAIAAQAASASPAHAVYLRQVHGTRVLRLNRDSVQTNGEPPEADAAITTETGVACTVQVADCLPVLFAAGTGRGVGAAHAGWRGLAGGVLEATLGALCDAAGCAPGDVHAWLGPCIGPSAFEVSEDVVRAFGASAAQPGAHFRTARREGKWLADLPGLARERLRAAGVLHLSGGTGCTVTDASRFFSFRRDGVTGRMAAAVWLDGRSGG